MKLPNAVKLPFLGDPVSQPMHRSGEPAEPEGETARILLTLEDIHANYNDIRALKGVNLSVRYGEIHALVGDHRAGKSTLVKVLSGALRKSAGRITYDGKTIEFFTPASAFRHGIGTVYQELNIIPSLNATENIFAGNMITNFFGRIHWTQMAEKTRRLFSSLNVDINTQMPLSKLSRGAQYMVELARVLAHQPKLLILDEVSGKLRPQEMEIVFSIIRDFKLQGRSIIYISHNMDEIFKIADRVTILRNGLSLNTEVVKDIDRIKLLKLTYSFLMSRNDLEKDNIALYSFKKYNEDIIKNLPNGVIILDAEGNIYLVNFAALRILGIRNKDHILHASIRTFLERLTITQIAEILHHVGKKDSRTWEEINLGHNRFCRLSVFPFQDEDYRFLGNIILLEDTTNDHFLKEYMVRTEKVASIAELAAGVAHEINNPLGTIQNHLELLKLMESHAGQKESIGKIEKEIERIVMIVQNLLSFSRLSELPEEEADLIAIVKDVLGLLQHLMKTKSIVVEQRFSHDVVRLMGNENKLRQVILNLVKNSIEAVPAGGHIKVNVRSSAVRGNVRLEIKDDGCGIPPDKKKDIFNPFYSTKNSKLNVGLGLTICQHIVEQYGGIISCKSTPGKGTSFTVQLPLRRDPLLQAEHAAGRATAAGV